MESYNTYFLLSGYFYLTNVLCFNLHPSCYLCQFVPFYCWEDAPQWISHHLFIHFPTDGYLSCFQGLEIVNKSAKKLLVYPILEGFLIRLAVESLFSESSFLVGS